MPKRYILALIVIALIFFGGIALIISLITGGGDQKPEETTISQPIAVQRSLSENGRSITFTTYGSVVSEEDRRAIKITITANERRIDILNGYNETISKSQVNSNTSAAFENLLIALQGAGYEVTQNTAVSDERSVCPEGVRYVYQAAYTTGDPHRSWSVSCGKKIGTFAGDQSTVQDLLEEQIPNYSTFVDDVDL